MKRHLLALAAMLMAAPAIADTPPSIWERTRDPSSGEAYALHRIVQERLIPTRVKEVDFANRERARVMLERVGAEHSKQALLRFDLGRVHHELGDDARAAQILKAALAEFADHPEAENAWMELAFACGKIGDHACESQSYVEVLRIETEEIRRHIPLLNQAETKMHLGDLTSAIEGYREVLRISGRVPASESAPLATWGLAVALDRSGDKMEAEREARFAIELERSMGLSNLLHTDTVFFFPEYEIHWYDGLACAAIARVATSATARAAWWKESEDSFAKYVRAAEGQNDRWLPIANVRHAEAKSEHERAAKAAEHEPKPPRLHRDVDL